ncbi:hypothetical protein OIN59_03130 [Acidovorax sp. D2M1]|uniref:Uncharacterized protein n=1 Tax=Acidovorax benzenivorans TaxID=2987520 RepID=A0ABT5RSS6_9BURK|nr:hypothetical protein [Acidovorax benzenivorans]MDD2176410.1 hypothetical protein [Acidovorax benzenivorans]
MSTTSTPLDELKTRARIALNAARRAGDHDAKLRHCLNDAARQVGFVHWDHARTVLGGFARPGDDFGTFWHAPRTGILLNQWFASHAEARAVHAQDPGAFVLPYRRQCMLVQAEFVAELGLNPQDPAWAALGRDLVAGYGCPAWGRLVGLRLAQMRAWA